MGRWAEEKKRDGKRLSELIIMYLTGHNLNWFEHGATNARVVGSIPVWAIHFSLGHKILVGSFQLRIVCDLVI